MATGAIAINNIVHSYKWVFWPTVLYPLMTSRLPLIYKFSATPLLLESCNFNFTFVLFLHLPSVVTRARVKILTSWKFPLCCVYVTSIWWFFLHVRRLNVPKKTALIESHTCHKGWRLTRWT